MSSAPLQTPPRGHFEYRERPPATTDNPTVSSLYNAKDRSDWKVLTLPKHSRLFKKSVMQPISLNTQTFEPGKPYRVPPGVYDEVMERYEKWERGIYLLQNPENDAGVAQTAELPDIDSVPEAAFAGGPRFL